MSNNDASLHLVRIVEKVNEGKVALFLGAGVSQAAGGPSTPDLITSIRNNFEKAKYYSDDIIDVCQAVIDCDYYGGRPELEKFVREKLGTLQPSKWHLELPKYGWSAIFTTNFDDLIEESFRRSTGSRREYRPVLTDDFNIADKSTLYIFKLMGDVKARVNDPGQMVLSRIDLIRSLKMREKCYEVLSDIIGDGTVIFIGYRGRDQIAFEIMDGVTSKYGVDGLMTSYMLLSDLGTVEGERLKYSKRKIVPLQFSFQEFMDYLSTKAKERSVPAPQKYLIHAYGYDLTFSPREIEPCQNFFHIMGEKDREQNPGSKDDFFRGINKSWGAYKEKWDFQRDMYIKDGLRDRITAELTKKTTSDNRVLMLLGMAGIGKTMMLRRIAYDSYVAGIPVLVFDSTKGKFDFKILDSFLMDMDRQLVNLTQGKVTCAKSLIILDDVSSLMVDPLDICSYLASRGRMALILTASRMHENEEFTPPKKDIVEIPQNLSKNETYRLAKHLEELGYLTSSDIWKEVILKELESSFFAAMYTLVDPARRPLGKIIADQFMQLSEEQKKVFLFVCAFHRFDIPINIELLARVSFNNNYEKLTEVVNDKKLRQIIVINQDIKQNILYSTYNRIIAQKTFDFFLSDPQRQKELYLEILDSTHFTLQKEKELVERLLIRNMGPSRNISGLRIEDLSELFLRICRRQPTRSLLHHLGLVQTRLKDYETAEATLQRALKFQERYVEAYRGESTRNILTSLGCMYVDWAEEELGKNEEKSTALFSKAEKYLQDAIRFHYPMPHPYHALARMYMRMGERCQGSPKQFDYYAQALDVIEEGKENVIPTKTRMLYEIDTLLQAHLENRTAIKAAINVLAKEHQSPRGYYLYSRALLARSKSLQGREKEDILEEGMSVITEGTARFPVDEPCLRLKAEITHQLYPGDEKKYFRALERWSQIPRAHSLQLLFDLAVLAFKSEYYKTSSDTFTKLERRSTGHPERFVVREYMVDEKGEKKLFRGTVMTPTTPYLGEIRVDSLPKLTYNIRFSPEMCNVAPRESDTVTFFIGFDFVGPRALDVTIIS